MIAKEKGYLIKGFDWDDLMINKQQIETPEWSTEELKSLVQWENFKTRLWFIITSPFIVKLGILKRIFTKPKNSYNFFSYVLSNINYKLFSRFRIAN